MTDIDLAIPDEVGGPFCPACGGRTRLVGIEAHPRLPRTDLRTYECVVCEGVQAVAAPHPSRSVNAVVVVGGAI